MTGLLKVRVATAIPGNCDRVVALCPEGQSLSEFPPVSGAISRLTRRRGWTGAEGQRIEGTPEGRPGPVVELRGIGPVSKLDGRKLARTTTAAVRDAATAGSRRIAMILPEVEAARGASAGEWLSREVALSCYRFERFLTRSGPARPKPPDVVLIPPSGETEGWRRGSTTGLAVAEASAYCRDLANTPPNEATPAWMAAEARRLGRELGARVTTLGPTELARRGMGGILAVGGGSANPPRLVRLEWGRGPHSIAIVGKGVTFDTGGISIKPAAAMDEMKWDKCGACAAMATLRAVAALDLPIRVRVYLPFAENMPGGAAYRPGDIIRCGNGKTVEILNTDAEGRLLLADALSWAASERPQAIVELSTLTGACVVALGLGAAGLYSPDDPLAEELLAAAEAAGERLWRMPLWPEFVEEMRGAHSDLRNSGGRWGSANTAAAFLSEFFAPVDRWAHLDIAGPAYVGGDDRARRGATGFGIALLVHWLASLAPPPGRSRQRAR